MIEISQEREAVDRESDDGCEKDTYVVPQVGNSPREPVYLISYSEELGSVNGYHFEFALTMS